MDIILRGGLIVAIGGMIPALAIGLIGQRPCGIYWSKPKPKVDLTSNVTGMAFAEAIAIYALVIAFIK